MRGNNGDSLEKRLTGVPRLLRDTRRKGRGEGVLRVLIEKRIIKGVVFGLKKFRFHFPTTNEEEENRVNLIKIPSGVRCWREGSSIVKGNGSTTKRRRQKIGQFQEDGVDCSLSFRQAGTRGQEKTFTVKGVYGWGGEGSYIEGRGIRGCITLEHATLGIVRERIQPRLCGGVSSRGKWKVTSALLKKGKNKGGKNDSNRRPGTKRR